MSDLAKRILGRLYPDIRGLGRRRVALEEMIDAEIAPLVEAARRLEQEVSKWEELMPCMNQSPCRDPNCRWCRAEVKAQHRINEAKKALRAVLMEVDGGA